MPSQVGATVTDSEEVTVPPFLFETSTVKGYVPDLDGTSDSTPSLDRRSVRY